MNDIGHGLQGSCSCAAVLVLLQNTVHESEGALLHFGLVKQMQAGLVPFELINLSFVQSSAVATVAYSMIQVVDVPCV